MKKNSKKLLALLLSASMTVGVLAGCGAKSTNNEVAPATENANEAISEKSEADGNTPDISEHVDITMYLVGDTPETYSDILAKVNEITEREINASLNVKWLSWSEHDAKYSLLFSGKEDFDLIFTAPAWCHYEQTVALGGFLELTEDMISKYMPDVWAQLPEVAWKQAKINGKIYMMPANFIEVNPLAATIRTDWMEQFGFTDIKSWDDMFAFMKACGENGKNAFAVKEDNPWGLYIGCIAEGCNPKGYCGLSGTPSGNSYIFYNGYDADSTKLTSLFDMEEFRNYCHQMKELADAGAIPDDVLATNFEERQTYMAGGKAAYFLWNTGTARNYANEINAAHPECKVQIFNFFEDDTFLASKYTNNGMGINVNTKNPERAMMMLNLLATNQEIMDLTSLGIQGVNWELNDDGTYSVLQPYNASNYWGWRNGDMIRNLYNPAATDVDKKYEQMNESYYQNIKPEHMLDYFGFDTTAVSTQVAAVEAADDTYWYPLLCGHVDDVDATIDQFKVALETAGLQDIIDEAQRQVDEYMSAQK